ncbi:flavin reductase family protein [candidate division KSB3 bacterium]|uniref:Flavin reductase family protein n=1 Tax=candidate division KSB3 bacterium TaxID=2044937 RepID=A0A9D5JW98_9BACT|nr:flavin reductase family protein [candidate division KSB3 bacterium]MBD3325293.1 flavin reductase family protein [candidate division KSB3 bacterium]
MPTTIVGATVHDAPNYITIAYIGIVNHNPPVIALGMGKSHYTNQGIKAHGTFSVNIPSQEMLTVTDYVGLFSGKTRDKGKLFTSFYGKLETAPMIEECPLNLECRLIKTVDLDGTNDVFMGEIVATYTDDRYLTNNLPDIKKMNPVVFSMHDNTYWAIGEHLGKAWSLGRAYGKDS